MKRGIAVLVLGALVCGCGGGGGGSSSADFVAAGNKICREDNAKFKALEQPTGSDIRPFLAKVLPLTEEDLSKLRGLDPPSDRSDTYDAWISDLQRGTDLTKKAQQAPSGDAATKLLGGSTAINKDADAKAKQLGLDDCLTNAGQGSS